MADKSKDNKRIAKNTLVVYGQLVLRMILGLYTSRLALEALGVSDFGLYSVMAGVVVLFTFISDSLSSTTIRYINVERGKPGGNLNRVFNVCHMLHIGMAILLFVLLEIGGIFYIIHFLNVEPGREGDAMFAFQIAAIMNCFGVINVPFCSLFNATEKFFFTAVVSISVKVVQLILLLWLLTYDGNRIRAFALIETLTLLTSFIVYHYYCYHRWPDVVRWRLVRKWSLYKEMMLFSYYNLLASIAGMARGQGSQLLINFFFGTVVNGAFAVAKTIERNFTPFASNIQNAASPQITQNYSSGDMDRVFYLTTRTGRYSLLMMLLAFFPLWAEMDFVLGLWLIQVPEGALEFCYMILLMTIVAVTDGGIWQVVNASGKVSKFRIVYSIITISCIPFGYLLLNSGNSACSLLALFIVADIIWRIIQLWMARRFLHFPVIDFCYETYLPIVKICLLMTVGLFASSQIPLDTSWWHGIRLLCVLALTMLLDYYVGLKNSERKKVLLVVKNKISSVFN